LKKKFAAKIADIQFCQYNPFLGIIPLELSDIYPAAHYLVSNTISIKEDFSEFMETWKIFLKNNTFRTIYAADDEFLRYYAKSSKVKIKFFNFKK